jgi:hypothetical protein
LSESSLQGPIVLKDGGVRFVGVGKTSLIQEAGFGEGDSARHRQSGKWQSACVSERVEKAANSSEGYEVDVVVENSRLSRAQLGKIRFRSGFDEGDVVGYVFEVGPIDSLVFSNGS